MSLQLNVVGWSGKEQAEDVAGNVTEVLYYKTAVAMCYCSQSSRSTDMAYIAPVGRQYSPSAEDCRVSPVCFCVSALAVCPPLQTPTVGRGGQTPTADTKKQAGKNDQ